MRSLPQPRYSRTRTIQRIFRSIVNLFSTGYLSDSSAFAHHTVLDKASHKTKIRTSRFTGKPTSRNTILNRLSTKLVSELIEDETIIGNVVKNEIGGIVGNTNTLNFLPAGSNALGSETIVNDVNYSAHNNKNRWAFWKSGERALVDL